MDSDVCERHADLTLIGCMWVNLQVAHWRRSTIFLVVLACANENISVMTRL